MSSHVTYLIPSVNFARLQARIEQLDKKAKKLGSKPVELKVLRTIVEKRKNEVLGHTYDYAIYECAITGEIPKYDGWRLIAVIKPHEVTGENLVREVPGEECPSKYRLADVTLCEHCQTKRRRKAVYVIHHDASGHRQVGSDCLADFLGHSDPESLVQAAQYAIDIHDLVRSACDEDWDGGGTKLPLMTPIHNFVTTVSAVIRTLGWLPSSKATDYDAPTHQIAWDICMRPEFMTKLIEEHKIHANENDAELASRAIAWAQGLTAENAANTYLYDLGVACRSDYVTPSTSGYVASVIAAYQRAHSTETDQKTSEYVGEINQRTLFESLKITKIIPYTSGIYPKTLVQFEDENGNALIWRASGSPAWLDHGKMVKVRATVVKHEIYRDVKQTTLQRVSYIEQENE